MFPPKPFSIVYEFNLSQILVAPFATEYNQAQAREQAMSLPKPQGNRGGGGGGSSKKTEPQQQPQEDEFTLRDASRLLLNLLQGILGK